MDRSLLSLLKQTVLIQTSTGADGYGQQAYGTAVSIPARIIGRNRLVRNVQGQEVISTVQIIVNGDVAVTTFSRITLPDGSTPLVIAVLEMPDAYGIPYHKVIYT